ncbi:MAG: Uma2 family endonuclease [Isosphaeraceae bacterium]
MATATTETPKQAEAPAGPLRPTPIVPPSDEPRLYRMTTDIYEAMVKAGVFGDVSPIYLWKGQLVLPMTKGPDHENALAALNALFVPLVGSERHVRLGSPVRIPDDSEPEPDVLILRGTVRDFHKRTPGPADVALAVEVADSSLRFDSGSKMSAYAEAGIPEYWVVNIPRQRVDVYSKPSGPGPSPSYADHRSCSPEEEILLTLDGREVGRIAVRDILVG